MAVEHVAECSGLAFSQFHNQKGNDIFCSFFEYLWGRTPLLHLVKLSPLWDGMSLKLFWSESKPDQLIKTVE